MEINKEIFRGYDIRGIYNKDLDENVAYLIGRAYATILNEKYNSNKCIVGYDNRESSVSLTNSLIKGLNSSGVDVINLGLVTSPMLYFANEKLNIHSGIMVTASHNPKEYNGFKIAFDKQGEICGDEIIYFRDKVLSNKFIEKNGRVKEYDIKNEYIDMMISKFNFKNKLKIVVDSGNGTASIIVKDIFDKLNLDVTYIFCDSDPNFPNHHPDPAEEENLEILKTKVKELNADLGIALDGDCDRVGIIDNKGNYIPSDYYMAIISKIILPKLDNKSVIFDVSCSKTLSDEIKKAGGTPIVYKTGNSYIKREMLKQNTLFGGEISGHTFFNDKFYGFDDGIYAGLRIVEIVDEFGDVSNITDTFTKYYSTPVLKLNATDKSKVLIVEEFKNYMINNNYNINDIDGVRCEFEDGFLIVRYSNTTPKLTIRFEATTKERLEEIKNKFMIVIENIIKKYCK